MEAGYDRTWAEIRLDNIEYNVSEVKSIVGNKTKIMAVIKANAYGHGAFKVAETLLNNGIERLAVATLDEAVQLRQKGCTAPIQILGHTFPGKAEIILNYDLIQTIFNMELAKELSYLAQKMGKKAKVHIKINTGMNRVGFQTCENTVKLIMEISRLPSLEIEGIMTHFATADEKDSCAVLTQFEKFMCFCRELEKVDVHIPIKHVANSAALVKFPEMRLDMVRPGIILYGLYPNSDIDRDLISLKPVMSLKANIVSISNISENEYLSYGRKYKTSKESCIATVPIGYADGYSRLNSNNGRVIVREGYAPVVGTVCMDFCLIDITGWKDRIAIGDQVVLLGSEGDAEVSAEELAEHTGTIAYEVVCKIGMRVPRVYIKHGKVTEIENYI
jgi:alanine racemase